MRIARFYDLLDSHGPDLSRWPGKLAQSARVLVSRDAQAAQELRAAHRLEALLKGLGGQADPCRATAALARVSSRLSGPLPAQHQSWLARWWPVELLNFDFAPAWSRVAVLAGVAGLGFMVGLANPTLPGLRSQPAPDTDLSAIVFEPDPLSSMRP